MVQSDDNQVLHIASDASVSGNGHSAASLGNLAIDLDGQLAWVDDYLVDLSYHEFELLRQLFERPNQIVPYDSLTMALWSSSGQRDLRHLNVLVHRLRTKLGGIRPYVIHTVRGRGYGLVQALRPSDAQSA